MGSSNEMMSDALSRLFAHSERQVQFTSAPIAADLHITEWHASQGISVSGRKIAIRSSNLLLQAHAFYVSLRRLSKQAAIFSTELRRAFIPHQPSRTARVDILT